VEEAIGRVCAGRDRHGALRIGGDFLASRDAVAGLEARIATLGSAPQEEAIGRAVNDTFAAQGVALEGVADLGNVREVIARVLAAKV
jgi:hypothetical protein